MIKENEKYSAYQGKGWQNRTGNQILDVQNGIIWNKCSVNSEWNDLKEVLLYIPEFDQPSIDDPNSIQHIDIIDFNKLAMQFKKMVNCLNQNKIKVHLIKNFFFRFLNIKKYHYNLMFVCDLFFMTPEGAIISRMASSVRAGEEKYVSKALADIGVPIIKTITGKGTFEGADAVWISKDTLLIGTGNRTNYEAFIQIKKCLKTQGINCINIHLPRGIQHLKAILQIVDSKLAVIRNNLFSDELFSILRKFGYNFIELPESISVTKRQALNFITIAPRQIIMVSDNKDIKKILTDNNIRIIAELDFSELIKGAGGICCATGVLCRKFIDM